MIGRRRADRLLDQRRATVRALRRLRALVGDIDTDRARPEAVVVALLEALPLEDCWHEVAPGAPLPELGPDGEVSALVQRRGARGLALPGAVAVADGGGGRFVLVADPAVGLTIEERLVASTMAALHVGAALRTTGPTPSRPAADRRSPTSPTSSAPPP